MIQDFVILVAKICGTMLPHFGKLMLCGEQ